LNYQVNSSNHNARGYLGAAGGGGVEGLTVAGMGAGRAAPLRKAGIPKKAFPRHAKPTRVQKVRKVTRPVHAAPRPYGNYAGYYDYLKNVGYVNRGMF
jgi:hypothetical protein